MNHPIRRFWYNNYHWLTTLAWAIAFAIILAVAEARDRISLIATVTGAVLSIFYFFQKQMLDESRLFEKLFIDFNKRYGRLNEGLKKIYHNHLNEPEVVETILDDYFNLCAEEYLFYSEGRIHPRAWQAWCHGMLFYLEHPVFKGYWKDNITPVAYYGLTLEAVQAGKDPYRDKPQFIRNLNKIKRSFFEKPRSAT